MRHTGITDSLESDGHSRNLTKSQLYLTHLSNNILDLILTAGVDGLTEAENLDFHLGYKVG